MIQFLIFFLLISNSILFMIMNHPLSMGLILMIQTFLLAIFTGIYTSMFWFSYSLFLIFMGGMLILFMYMTSLASNETFLFKINVTLIKNLLMITMIFLIILFMMDFKSLLMNNKITNYDNSNMFLMKNLIEQNNLMLNKMYNFPMNMITILLVNYLFLTLIATVKITNIFKGPLRPKYL